MMVRILSLSCLLLALAVSHLASAQSDVPGGTLATSTSPVQQCVLPILKTPPADHPLLYKVGVFGIRGAEQAYEDYNATFQSYLTATVGSQFDPPLQFEVVPIFNSPEGYLDFLASGALDLMFMHTGAYSCIESEVQARSLATVISKRTVGGQVYELNGYGGVIFTRADNTEIQTLQDIRGKRTSCVSIIAFGSGQVQFQSLTEAGLHHIQDVQQLVFMEKQNRVVHAVLKGEVDVGYVRTDQLERTIDETTGELVDMSLIKVIEPQANLTDDGKPFPFPSTSKLYPEWSLSAFPHVSNSVASAVQAEIFQMGQHAAIAEPLLECFDQNGCQGELLSEDASQQCLQDCFNNLDLSLFQNCDTTPELALLAHEAMRKGRIAGWSPSASYMQVRNMQEETGFLQFDSENSLQCMRATNLADAVTCPPGQFKRSNEEIERGCMEQGIDCYGFQCLCSPCVKAFDVDFFDVNILEQRDDDDNEQEEAQQQQQQVVRIGAGCSKFDICGRVEQGKQIKFMAIDNRKRKRAAFTVEMLQGSDIQLYNMTLSNGNLSDNPLYEFTFDATSQQVGELIIKVLVNNEQISQSPFRLSVTNKDCEAATGSDRRVADEMGNCVCARGYSEVGDQCVATVIIWMVVLVPCLLVIGIGVLVYVDIKRRQADALWLVDPEELIYADPPTILGRGTFGMVLQAEFRGTAVAVKRVLPRKANIRAGRGSLATKSRSSLATGSRSRSREGTVRFSFVDVETGEMGQREDKLGTKSHHAFAGHILGSHTIKNLRLSASNLKFWEGISKSRYQGLERAFIKEMRLLSKLRHPCICTCLGAVLGPKTEPMMVMELMEMGSLYDLLHNECMFLDGQILLPILQDVARGLRFLHASDPVIVHGDLKSANVLVDRRFRAKVADLGLARRGDRKSATGTPFWMAPELLRNESPNTPESDVFSFGITIYEVLSRKAPYEGEDSREVLIMVSDENVNKRPPVPKNSPAAAASLMRACLQSDPSERPTAEDLDLQLRLLEAANIDPTRSQSLRFVATDQKRSDDLLSQLFPEHIAIALRDGKKVEPEPFDCVSVYFSDIVGYTQISSSLSPTKVSSLLDRLYTKFDHLCDTLCVFKVETVGDAYMTVTNVAEDQPNHAHIMAQFALEAQRVAAETLIDEDDPDRGYVQIRSGMHSGPCVAHVVGTRNPRYSIIGDTVNTASRMESNSKPGCIQCSEATAKLLQDDTSVIEVEFRCTSDIKGKGEMDLYWVRHSDAGTVSLTEDDSMLNEHGEKFQDEEMPPVRNSGADLATNRVPSSPENEHSTAE